MFRGFRESDGLPNNGMEQMRNKPRTAHAWAFGSRRIILGCKRNTLKTKLILVEGLPGSGKSTTAQFIWMQLQKHGVKCRWYYEEESPHPVALFDRSSVHKTTTEILLGALSKWQSFVAKAVHADEISIIESRLFQDNIFPLLMEDLDRPRILAFIHAITEVCRYLDPVLCYFFQSNYAQTLRRICHQRGPCIERLYITRANQSVFGQRQRLQGFAGLYSFGKP